MTLTKYNFEPSENLGKAKIFSWVLKNSFHQGNDNQQKNCAQILMEVAGKRRKKNTFSMQRLECLESLSKMLLIFGTASSEV